MEGEIKVTFLATNLIHFLSFNYTLIIKRVIETGKEH